MITAKKIKIIAKYNGDGDMWNRLSTYEEKMELNYQEWKLMDDLIQDLTLVQNSATSEEYQLNVQLILNTNFDSEETIKLLKEIVFKT